MSLQDYLRALRRDWWIVVACVLLGALVAAGATLSQHPVYSAGTTLFVSNIGDGTPTDRAAGNNFVVSRTASYADLVGTASVLEPAGRVVGETENEMAQSVVSASREDSNLIDITATSPSAEGAARKANAVAQALSDAVDSIEGSTSADTRVEVDVVSAAPVPTIATSPQPRTNVIIGLIVGLALGFATIVAIQALSSRLRGPSDVAQLTNLTPTAIPESARGRGRRRGHASELQREAYRTLRSNLRYGLGTQGSVTIATIVPGTDSYRLANELARAFGETGAAALLIDADFREKPSQLRSRRAAPPTPEEPGLADLLRGERELEQVLADGPSPGTRVLARGRIDVSSSQALSSDAMETFMRDACAAYEFVIVVAPPLLERSESAVLAAHARTTVLAMQARSTRRGDLMFAMERLNGVGVRSLSLVIEDVSRLDMHPSPRMLFDPLKIEPESPLASL